MNRHALLVVSVVLAFANVGAAWLLVIREATASEPPAAASCPPCPPCPASEPSTVPEAAKQAQEALQDARKALDASSR